MNTAHLLNFVLYFLIGFLFTNGLPHFAAGSAGLPFRLFTLDGAAPKVNVVWGMSNFIAATILLTWRLSVAGVGTGEVIALAVGIWAAILMFGAGAAWFYRALGPKTGWVSSSAEPASTPAQLEHKADAVSSHHDR